MNVEQPGRVVEALLGFWAGAGPNPAAAASTAAPGNGTGTGVLEA